MSYTVLFRIEVIIVENLKPNYTAIFHFCVVCLIVSQQMALTVWKEAMIENMKEPLVKALLEEIRK